MCVVSTCLSSIIRICAWACCLEFDIVLLSSIKVQTRCLSFLYVSRVLWGLHMECCPDSTIFQRESIRFSCSLGIQPSPYGLVSIKEVKTRRTRRVLRTFSSPNITLNIRQRSLFHHCRTLPLLLFDPP